MTLTTLFDKKSESQHQFVPIDGLWRVSVEQYHAMIASGALSEENPIELLQGWLVQKMPKKPKHSVINRLLFDALSQMPLSGWFVHMQEPITTANSEPEPDLAIIKGTVRDYLEQHPQPEQIAIVIEVSDATLQRDRTLKKQLYAEANIPVYWIVNLLDNQIEVYSEPFNSTTGADYQQQQTFSTNESAPVRVAGADAGHVSVAALFSE